MHDANLLGFLTSTHTHTVTLGNMYRPERQEVDSRLYFQISNNSCIIEAYIHSFIHSLILLVFPHGLLMMLFVAESSSPHLSSDPILHVNF